MANIMEQARYILVFLAIVHVFHHELIEGRLIQNMVDKQNNNKAIIKTIKDDNGEIIDCFDIYKQPAFDHPSLRNHTLQMKPSSYPQGMKEEDLVIELSQSWHKNGECPEGTVPILRTTRKNYGLTPSSSQYLNITKVANADTSEFAIVTAVADTFNGAEAKLNLWKPTVETDFEMTSSKILLGAGNKNDDTWNTIEAGWTVNPLLQLDREPRFFVYWTSDNYKSKGCYNLLCPGFVQTSKQYSFDYIPNPVSVYNGDQYELSVSIFKDKSNGNWWLKLNGNEIGYWPSSIFTTLSEKATEIQWGGAIVNTHPKGKHTTTQMGSGHFSSEGKGKASYVRNLGIIDETNTLKDPENIEAFSTNSNCYDVHIEERREPNYGKHFFFGGPGLSPKCP